MNSNGRICSVLQVLILSRKDHLNETTGTIPALYAYSTLVNFFKIMNDHHDHHDNHENHDAHRVHYPEDPEFNKEILEAEITLPCPARTPTFCDTTQNPVLMYHDGFHQNLKHTFSIYYSLNSSPETITHKWTSSSLITTNASRMLPCHQPCLNFLVSSFTLDSKLKFIFAMFITILFTVFAEYLSFYRHKLQALEETPIDTRSFSIQTSSSQRVKMKKAIKISIVYGIQYLSGYLIMIIVMTFSYELAFCVMIGHVIGSTLFLESGDRGAQVNSGGTCHGVSQHHNMLNVEDESPSFIGLTQNEDKYHNK